MTLRALWIAAVGVVVLGAQPPSFPLSAVRPGQVGTGRTVFSGERVEEFRVEILGVLENVGPRQSIILGRLSGGPLERTGVMQGMSGSPVYIEGKLLGAVALAFPYAKEAVAGIRPIEEMLAVPATGGVPGRRSGPVAGLEAPRPGGLTEALWSWLPRRGGAVLAGGQQMTEIATPVSFSGFTGRTIEQFGEALRALGFAPQQGMGGGGRAAPMGDPKLLEAGSMISVQLMRGDLSVGADGTVTLVAGDKVYAFGHRLLSIGSTELPFARAEVLTLLPSLNSSFKISVPKENMGTIYTDQTAAIAGVVGRAATMAPVEVTLTRPGVSGLSETTYRMEMVRDPFLSPVLLQMAAFSSLDVSERMLGPATVRLEGEVRFEGESEVLRLRNIFAGDFSVPLLASMGAVAPLSYAAQSGFRELKVKDAKLRLEAWEEKREWRIVQAWCSPTTLRGGDNLEVTVVLQGTDGQEEIRKVPYRVAPGTLPGPIYITVSDATTANLAEYQRFLQSAPKSAREVVRLMNELRPNTHAYVRVWRQTPSFAVAGKSLPAPPASAVGVLARDQSAVGGVSPLAQARIAELMLDGGGRAIAGTQTIKVEVKP